MQARYALERLTFTVQELSQEHGGERLEHALAAYGECRAGRSAAEKMLGKPEWVIILTNNL